ncbi:plasma kallikrein [Trichonephila clavipes]|uniref:Plasma kallikrein n=1 Tax=Trichonephila clavipes TaxID=2585209 RepID=A0A8X6W0D3_TRICX|nr:plasma kallikrein [Trichonephila clavipes]
MLDAKWRIVTCIIAVTLSILHPCETFLGISIKRDDSNTCYYDGGRHQCTFFLFCTLIGGTSVGSCPGSLLSTCCVTQSNHVRRSPTKVQSNSHQSYSHLPDSLDQRVLSKEQEYAVRNCWEQGTREGTHARKTGSGATRKTTRREDRRIVRQALVDRTVIRSMIRADVGVAIVPQTISRHLAEANLKSKRPFRPLPLTPEHRQLRLQWCQARSMWNVTDWQRLCLVMNPGLLW